MPSIAADWARDGDKIPALTRDLVDTMSKSAGLGLSAIQIGLPIRAFALAVTKEGIDLKIDEAAFANDGIVVVNPTIELFGDETEVEEGCLSFPGQFVSVWRKPRVILRAEYWFDSLGQPFESATVAMLSGEGFTASGALHLQGVAAQAAQHEMEHLDGKLLIDHATPLAKRLIEMRMKRFAKEMVRKYGAKGQA